MAQIGAVAPKKKKWVAVWKITGQEWVPGPGDSRCVAGPGMVKLIEMLETAWC
jgi:hypothetical protein